MQTPCAPHRTETLSARLRPREADLVRQAAAAAGVTLSELIRDAVAREARERLRRKADDTTPRHLGGRSNGPSE